MVPVPACLMPDGSFNVSLKEQNEMVIPIHLCVNFANFYGFRLHSYDRTAHTNTTDFNCAVQDLIESHSYILRTSHGKT